MNKHLFNVNFTEQMDDRDAELRGLFDNFFFEDKFNFFWGGFYIKTVP